MSDSSCCDRAASLMTRWNCELAWIIGSPDSDPFERLRYALELGEFVGREPRRGRFGGLAAQRGEDREVVDRRIRRHAHDGHPLRGAIETSPWKDSLSSASWTGVRLMPNSSAMRSRSRRVSGGRVPVRIRSRSSRTARCRTVPPID
jgi:hypothetical protein